MVFKRSVIHRPPPLLPGLLARPPAAPPKIIPRISRDSRELLGNHGPVTIRRSGHIVQDRPSPLVRWADVPHLSASVSRCPPWLGSSHRGC